MTTLVADNYAGYLSTGDSEGHGDIKRYLQEAIAYILSYRSETHEVSDLTFCYQDSSQAPFVEAEGISGLQEAVGLMEVSENNLRAIEFLEEWFSEPDDLGEQFWEEFRKELKANRFTIP
jgi:hypothetical protein